MLFLLIIFFIAVVFFEVPNLIKNKYWRELIVFSSLLFASFILTILQITGVIVIYPAKYIIYLIKDILHLAYQ
jgi:hypothetical protein